MAEENSKKISKISDQTLENIKNSSAYGLPDRPSERGMSAADIKKSFYAPMIKASDSLAAEINRVVDEANEGFKSVEERFEREGGKALDEKIAKNSEKIEENATAQAEKNKSLDEEIGKRVKYEDIIDSVNSEEAEKPLSARQGKVLDEKIAANRNAQNTKNEELDKKISDNKKAQDTKNEELDKKISDNKKEQDDKNGLIDGEIAGIKKSGVCNIGLEYNDILYKFRAVLYNKEGEVISTSDYIDMPLEELISHVEVSDDGDTLILTLKTGQSVSVDVTKIIRGLTTDEGLKEALDSLEESLKGELVPKERSIAGVSLEEDISAEDLKEGIGFEDGVKAVAKVCSVPLMKLIDEKRLKAYAEDGGYYFSENNWKAFIGDEASGKNGYNRVYVERSKERGTYGMYALSPDANLIYNAWYSKADWETRFATEHPGEEFREPYDEEYPLLGSVGQRRDNGQFAVPLLPLLESDAASKHYVDKQDKVLSDYDAVLLEEIRKVYSELTSMRDDVYRGTVGLRYVRYQGDEGWTCVLGGTIPDSREIEIAGYIKGTPVIKIEQNAFSSINLERVSVPATINTFAYNAFSGTVSKVYIKDLAKWCEANFDYGGSPVKSGTLVYTDGDLIRSLNIPHGVRSIKSRAFMHWTTITSLYLPYTVTTIKQLAFQYCTNLTSLNFQYELQFIEAQAFGGCGNLTNVYFAKKPAELSSSAFSGCVNLKNIYVPWSEGEVKGTPWGAEFATIHYNS